jgi:tetratricopeptide (TPR) repeat protein
MDYTYGNPGKKDDPIQPIMDIIIASLMKSDEGTIVEGLESLTSRIMFLIKNNDFKDDDELVFSVNIFSHFSEIGTLATSKRDENASIQIIRTIHRIGYMATDQNHRFAANEAAKTLEKIGENAIKMDLPVVVLEVIDALREIGGNAAKHELLATIGMTTMALETIGLQYTKQAGFRAINGLDKIGVEIANHKLDSGFEHYRVGIVESIKAICLKSIEQGLYVGNAIRALEAIGLKTAEKAFNEATDRVVDVLKIIETRSDEVKNERTMIETAISLGNVLSACDSNEEAIQEYNKAIDVDSKSFRAWSGKGDTLMKMGRYEDALNVYEKLLELGPATIGWYKKESALRSLGRNLEADAALATLNEWKNKAEHSNKFFDLTGNAQAAILMSQFEDAVKLYDEALEIRPKSARVWYYKGEVLCKIGRNAEADYAFAKAKELGYTG